MLNVILRQVEGLQAGQTRQSSDSLDVVLRQVELLKMEVVEVFDLLNLVLAKREQCETLVAREALNAGDFVVVEAQVLHVGIEHDVLNHLDLVVRVVNHF